MSYTGFFKLQEELGELQTALAKLAVFPDMEHPDGKGDTRRRVQNEIADVMAIVNWFALKNGFDFHAIGKRTTLKEMRYDDFDKKGNMKEL